MIIINDKEYEINTNVNMGIYRRYKEEPGNITYQYDFISNVLIPRPTHEEIDELFGMDDIEDVMLKFSEAQKKKNTEFKKKLSR